MSTLTIIIVLSFIGFTYVLEGMANRETKNMFDSLDNE